MGIGAQGPGASRQGYGGGRGSGNQMPGAWVAKADAGVGLPKAGWMSWGIILCQGSKLCYWLCFCSLSLSLVSQSACSCNFMLFLSTTALGLRLSPPCRSAQAGTVPCPLPLPAAQPNSIYWVLSLL